MRLRNLIILFSIVSIGYFSCTPSNETLPDPSLYGISPDHGYMSQTVTINGENFPDDSTRVRLIFNGISVPIISYTQTAIFFSVPRISPAPTIPIAVIVTIDNVEAGRFSFTYNFNYKLVSITSGQMGDEDGPYNQNKTREIEGLVLDNNDNIYFAQGGLPRIRKITPDSMMSTMAGDGTRGYLDGNGTNARIAWIENLTIDPDGNLYFFDDDYNNGGQNPAIRKVDPQKNVTTYIPMPTGTHVQGIKRGKSGTFYISNSNQIGKITPNGTLTWLISSPLWGDVDGLAGAAKFHLNGNIEVNEDETKLYVNDIQPVANLVFRSKVKVFDINTNILTTIAGNSTMLDGDGNALDVGFNLIGSTLLDKTGGLYICDTYNSKVKYLKNGQVTTILGAAGEGDVDGLLNQARVFRPNGIAVNSKGEIILACPGNNKVKKIITE